MGWRLIGLAILIGQAVLIPLVYSPCWQTWDDAALAMLVNGYGLAAYPSIHIFYCNFIWGWLIQQLPDFCSISNYTWALYGCTLLAVAILWLALTAKRSLVLLKFVTVAAILFYACLNPQFTVTAMLGALAALCCFLVFQASGKWRWLAAALACAVLAFLVRDWCLGFIALLGLPAIRWRKLLANKPALAICSICAILLAGLYALNLVLLKDSQSQATLAWNSMRQKLSDAHAGKMLAQQPALLRQYGYSENDINLLATHFSLAAPLMRNDKLEAMLAQSDFGVSNAVNLEKVAITFDWFLSWPLWLILLSAPILLLSRFSLRSCLIFMLFGLIFLCIGYFNRGGVWIDRIYYPSAFALACLLLLMPVNRALERHIRLSRNFETLLTGFLLLLALLAFSKANLVESWRLGQRNLAAEQQLLDGAIWYGHPVRIEQIYRPFAKITDLRQLQFQGAGWTARLQNTRKYIDPEQLDGFDHAFRRGFKIATGSEHLDYLGRYCGERLAGEFIQQPLGNAYFYYVQCRWPEAPAH